jgi:hypothetical protein
LPVFLIFYIKIQRSPKFIKESAFEFDSQMVKARGRSGVALKVFPEGGGQDRKWRLVKAWPEPELR